MTALQIVNAIVARSLAATCIEMDVPPRLIFARDTNDRTNQARAVAMYVAQSAGLSFRDLCEGFDRSDSSVARLLRNVVDRIRADAEFADMVRRIREAA